VSTLYKFFNRVLSFLIFICEIKKLDYKYKSRLLNLKSLCKSPCGICDDNLFNCLISVCVCVCVCVFSQFFYVIFISEMFLKRKYAAIFH